MPCRAPLVAHSFPAEFPVDNEPFRAALAEHNWQRTIAGFPQSSFLDLDRESQSAVLARAQEFKQTPPARWYFYSVGPEPETFGPDPWWIRAFVAAHKFVDGLLASMRRTWWL